MGDVQCKTSVKSVAKFFKFSIGVFKGHGLYLKRSF